MVTTYLSLYKNITPELFNKKIIKNKKYITYIIFFAELDTTLRYTESNQILQLPYDTSS